MKWRNPRFIYLLFIILNVWLDQKLIACLQIVKNQQQENKSYSINLSTSVLLYKSLVQSLSNVYCSLYIKKWRSLVLGHFISLSRNNYTMQWKYYHISMHLQVFSYNIEVSAIMFAVQYRVLVTDSDTGLYIWPMIIF